MSGSDLLSSKILCRAGPSSTWDALEKVKIQLAYPYDKLLSIQTSDSRTWMICIRCCLNDLMVTVLTVHTLNDQIQLPVGHHHQLDALPQCLMKLRIIEPAQVRLTVLSYLLEKNVWWTKNHLPIIRLLSDFFSVAKGFGRAKTPDTQDNCSFPSTQTTQSYKQKARTL